MSSTHRSGLFINRARIYHLLYLLLLQQEETSKEKKKNETQSLFARRRIALYALFKPVRSICDYSVR